MLFLFAHLCVGSDREKSLPPKCTVLLLLLLRRECVHKYVCSLALVSFDEWRIDTPNVFLGEFYLFNGICCGFYDMMINYKLRMTPKPLGTIVNGVRIKYSLTHTEVDYYLHSLCACPW